MRAYPGLGEFSFPAHGFAGSGVAFQSFADDGLLALLGHPGLHFRFRGVGVLAQEEHGVVVSGAIRFPSPECGCTTNSPSSAVELLFGRENSFA